METIIGIEIYPIISLIIFFLFFIGIIYWVMRMDRKHIIEVGNLPLEK
jgi:cbb3-type cytochrome oxidase subunit 3